MATPSNEAFGAKDAEIQFTKVEPHYPKAGGAPAYWREQGLMSRTGSAL